MVGRLMNFRRKSVVDSGEPMGNMSAADLMIMHEVSCHVENIRGSIECNPGSVSSATPVVLDYATIIAVSYMIPAAVSLHA